MSMNIHQKHLTSQIEITNLIEEAVVNASARRNQVLDAEEPLSEISEEEEKNIRGGVRIVLGGFLLLDF